MVNWTLLCHCSLLWQVWEDWWTHEWKNGKKKHNTWAVNAINYYPNTYYVINVTSNRTVDSLLQTVLSLAAATASLQVQNPSSASLSPQFFSMPPLVASRCPGCDCCFSRNHTCTSERGVACGPMQFSHARKGAIAPPPPLQRYYHTEAPHPPLGLN